MDKLPKKRGKKPKSHKQTDTNISNSTLEKKKRGRKPKPKDIKLTEKKIPKKRGRKPLDPTKKIPITNQLIEENLILHLPIKSEEINHTSDTLLMKYNPIITTPQPFSIVNNFKEIETIDNPIDNSINTSSNLENSLNNISPQHNFNQTVINNSNNNSENNKDVLNNNNNSDNNNSNSNSNNNNSNSNNSDNNKDVLNNFKNVCKNYKNNPVLFEKNRVLPILLEYNELNKKNEWPTSVNIACFWCCESFTTIPVGIPIKKIDNTYHMYGNFCSPECAAGSIFDSKIYLNDCWERYSLLNIVYGNHKPIKIAPSKLCLKKFGGRLSIDEYRSICTKFDKSYKLLIPPMISVLPMIEEINLNDENNNIDMYVLNKEHIKKSNEEYRLKRNKPLPDSKYTLESCMHLKVL